MIYIIAACSRNRVIGHDGDLPWHLPTDMRHFRELTTGGTVLMGRKTFESLPAAFRPLPHRRNLVLTSGRDVVAPGVEVFGSLESALEASAGECFVIGGERVFREALPLAARVYMTELDGDCEGDAFFPVLDREEWICVEESDPVIENGHRYVFRVYDRTA